MIELYVISMFSTFFTYERLTLEILLAAYCSFRHTLQRFLPFLPHRQHRTQNTITLCLHISFRVTRSLYYKTLD